MRSTIVSRLLRWGNVEHLKRHHLRRFSAPSDGTVALAKQKYVPSTGTYPKGFLAGTAHAGVKASNAHFDDLVVIASEIPCVATATFTKNIYRAAPVTVSSHILKNRNLQGLRGIVINSGCANAVTGEGGREDALDMVDAVDKALASTFSGLSPEVFGSRTKSDGLDGARSLVMSTGVIGQRLPMARILPKIPDAVSSLGSSHDHWLKAARAICTTDTFPKLISRQFELPSHPETVFSIIGMTKGAGMIHPNMATLLGIICTDAPVDHKSINYLLKSAVNRSFNCISIDGDTSTNDTVALFANGAAAKEHNKHVIRYHRNRSQNDLDTKIFYKAVLELSKDLAQLVVRDGEGATKFVKIGVWNAPTSQMAHRIASRIACSPLVKTALYGKDANWGRILCAVGNTASAIGKIDPSATSVSFISEKGDRLELLTKGEPQNVDEIRAAEYLAKEDLHIEVDLGCGRGKNPGTYFWTCDFSHEYVTINGDYRT